MSVVGNAVIIVNSAQMDICRHGKGHTSGRLSLEIHHKSVLFNEVLASKIKMQHHLVVTIRLKYTSHYYLTIPRAQTPFPLDGMKNPA